MWRYFDTMQATLERTAAPSRSSSATRSWRCSESRPSTRTTPSGGAGGVRDAGALDRVNDELAREYGVRLATRTGVNTGEVIVGDATADQKLATGDAVNVAARLEQAAREGEVLVGEATYRLVARCRRRRARPPVEAKGKSRPLAAWALLGVRPDVPGLRPPHPHAVRRPPRRARGGPSRIRDAPCGSRRARSPRSSGHPGSASPASPGRRCARSRRRRAWSSAAASPTATASRTSRSPRSCATLPGPDPEAGLARAPRERRAREVATRLILGAIGASDEPGSPEETAWAFRRLFETLAASRPLVVAVDDIHWAEPTLLDLLEYVLGFSGGAPILLLCLARPDLFDTRPSWAAPRPRTSLVTLSPLSPDESEELVEGLMLDGAGRAGAAGSDRRTRPRGTRCSSSRCWPCSPTTRRRRRGRAGDDPGAPGGPHRPAGAGESAPCSSEPRSRGACSTAAAVAELLPPEGTDGLGGHAARPHAQGAARPGSLALRGRRRLPLQPRAGPGRRLRIHAEGASRRPPRAARFLARGARRRAADRAGRDRRLPPRAGVPQPRRTRPPRRRRPRRRLRGGMLLGRAGRRALDRDEFGAAATLLERACRLLAVEPAERASAPHRPRPCAPRHGSARRRRRGPRRGDRGGQAGRRRADRAAGRDGARPSHVHARTVGARRPPRRSRSVRSPSSSASAATRTSPTPGS